MTLGEKIRLLRTERNITQTDLAKLLDTAKSHLWRYEKDQNVPSADMIRRMATLFNVSSDYLLFDKTERGNVTKISDSKLLEQFEQVDQLDENYKTHIKFILDLAITNSKIKKMTA